MCGGRNPAGYVYCGSCGHPHPATREAPPTAPNRILPPEEPEPIAWPVDATAPLPLPPTPLPPSAPAGAPTSDRAARPADPGWGGPASGWEEEPDRSSRARWLLVGAAVVVALAAVFVTLWFITSPGSGTSGAAPPTSTSSSGSPSSGSAGPSSSPATLPAGAVACPSTFDAGSGTAYQHSARGNDGTSCPFAESVRKAYLDSGSVDQQVTVTARSPVTKKDYQMTCSGSGLVTCQGGATDGILVYLY